MKALALLLVFARAPVPGRCKTRLMPRHGARGAAALHRQLCTLTLQHAQASGLPVELWCAPDSGHGFFHRCRRTQGVVLRRQCRGDLGRRMRHALAAGLRRAERVLLVGTDCVLLNPERLHAAAAALNGFDGVLQAAEDGGYVLIGVRRAVPALRGIAWSSGRERAQTESRVRRQGLHWTRLPALWDVDHPQDVRRARRAGLLPRGPRQAPD